MENGDDALMTARADAWMPLYIADYMRDTPHLSVEQHGAYFLLIMACWTRGGKLPNDPRQLAQIARMSPHSWRKSSDVLLEFFRVDGAIITHGRVLKELGRAAELSAKRSGAGTGGAASRWGQPEVSGTRSERLSAARQLGTHTKEEWNFIVDICKNSCVKCHAKSDGLVGGSLCKDHITPVYAGGSDGIENLQPLCRNCNSSKGSDQTDLRPGDWPEQLAKRLANARQAPGPSPSPSPSPLQPPTEIEDNPVSSETVVLFPQAEPSILPCQQATDAWNEMATRSGLSPIRSLNDARRKQLKARLTEHGLDGWGEMLRRLEPSGFLNGNGSTGWRADFDFVIKSTNFLKIIEGKYDDRQPGPSAKFAAKDANLARALAGARTAAARRDQFG